MWFEFSNNEILSASCSNFLYENCLLSETIFGKSNYRRQTGLHFLYCNLFFEYFSWLHWRFVSNLSTHTLWALQKVWLYTTYKVSWDNELLCVILWNCCYHQSKSPHVTMRNWEGKWVKIIETMRQIGILLIISSRVTIDCFSIFFVSLDLSLHKKICL